MKRQKVAEIELADGSLMIKRVALALSRTAKSAEALARGLLARRMNAEIVLAGR